MKLKLKIKIEGPAVAPACKYRTSAVKSSGQVSLKWYTGDFFGETALLEGRATRAASVRCMTGVEVMMLDREVFKQVAGGQAVGGERRQRRSC